MKLLLLPTLGILIATEAFAGSASWSLKPASSDWNTAANWTPGTVPNGPADVATFDSSSVTSLSISASVEVDSIVFDPGADAFIIGSNARVTLTISGAGVMNNSGVLQHFANHKNKMVAAKIYFLNAAIAGDSIVYDNWTHGQGVENPLIQFEDRTSAGSAKFYNHGGSYSGRAGVIEFQGHATAANGIFRNTGVGDEQFPTINFRDHATAGQAVFVNEVDAEGQINFMDGSTADHAKFTNQSAFDSSVNFYNKSTAGDATILNAGGDSSNEAGFTFFQDNSTAGNGTFIANGGLTDYFGNASVEFVGTSTAGTGTFVANGAELAGDFAYGGEIIIADESTADHGTFYANPGKVAGASGGIIYVQNAASAGNGIFYAKGATVDGAFGGRVKFDFEPPTAANSTLIATNGIGTSEEAGGGILFRYASLGGETQIELFGNGFLDLRDHDTPEVTIGSLEGDGLVFLGKANLSVGSNNLSTRFSGLIEENSAGAVGALTKIGSGSLTLTGANTYSGGTTIEGGRLLVNNTTGSATGSGPVQVNGGQLGGRGTIAGAVTVGTGSGPGAFLIPTRLAEQASTIGIQGSLTFNADATYKCGVNSQSAAADNVAANGVVIDGAQFLLLDASGLQLPPGTILTMIDNTSADPISGTFSNLADGFTVTVGNNTYQANYEGGDGNDLTLTVVP